jgi:hypothetical protein
VNLDSRVRAVERIVGNGGCPQCRQRVVNLDATAPDPAPALCPNCGAPVLTIVVRRIRRTAHAGLSREDQR